MRLFREERRSSGLRIGPDRLPSAAITAQRVLEITSRASVKAADVVHAVQGDPATVIALLQAAGRAGPEDGRCNSLQVAIERLGIARALCVCLGFRLVDRSSAGAIDYLHHWQHAVLRSAYAGAIARRLRRADWDCIQTAAVLCNLRDMVMAPVGPTASDEDMAAWLAGQAISDVLVNLVTESHSGRTAWVDIDEAASCIVLAESMADVWLCADWEATTAHTQALAQQMFGAIPDLCVWVFGVLGPQAVELDSLLRINYPSRRKLIHLYSSAHKLRESCCTANQATGVAGNNHCRRQDTL